MLVNGRVGHHICHARGLRQGDPLSPLLFVLVMEVLNAMVREADRGGLLSPFHGDHFEHRMSLYADDLVLFLAPKLEDFSCIRAILDLFAGTSGLLTNVDKCQISPIHYTDKEIDLVWQVFPCQLSPLPCRYLGALLSVGRLHRSNEQWLMDAVAARLPT